MDDRYHGDRQDYRDSSQGRYDYEGSYPSRSIYNEDDPSRRYGFEGSFGSHEARYQHQQPRGAGNFGDMPPPPPPPRGRVYGSFDLYEDRTLFPPPPPPRGHQAADEEEEDDPERRAYEAELQRVAADLDRVGFVSIVWKG
jgi:hypothetical protein